jgi:methionyl-tRNA formyltransferase
VRTVYLGTSEFAAAILERLASGAHRPVLVLSRPDRPRGRGRQLGAPPVAERARSLGLALEQPDNANDANTLASIAAVAPDVIVVCAFGALIKEPLLSSYELLNVHPSLLPRWRGAAPIERTIMAGDADAGVSIMRLTAGLDSGPVCLAGAEAIRSEDTYGSLAARLQELGAGLLLEALDRKAQATPLAFVEQDDTLATYADKISSEDRLLDPSRPAEELERVVRALHPHIGARAQLDDGSFLGVRAAALVADPEPEIDVANTDLGVSEQSGRLLLVCSTGALELRNVQPPGGRPMDAGAYLRGHGLPGRR